MAKQATRLTGGPGEKDRQAAGWRAVQYVDAAQVRRVLAEHGALG